MTTLAGLAGGFARLAIANVTREFPYAPAHLVGGPDDLALPRVYHPAFYGAYDWHSSVHMHWLLVRLLRRYRLAIDATAVKRVLDAHLTPAHLAAEAAYLRANPTFERPYGWAWLLALAAECQLAGDDGARWADALRPATTVVSELILRWLSKATYPVRHGIHTNSAFALGLILDSAIPAEVTSVAPAAAAAVRDWFAADQDYPAAWEPSGEDFLSPMLTEADAMRRTLPPQAFAAWLTRFLPGLADGKPRTLLEQPVVSDPHDPKIGHLLGLALSRASALRSIASALPPGDWRVPVLTDAADQHLAASLPHVTSGDFSTDHWLATFAVLALDGPAGAEIPIHKL